LEGDDAIPPDEGPILCEAVPRPQEHHEYGDIHNGREDPIREYSDEFTVRVTSKPEEIKELLETGFEYVCTKDELMFFRKRK
jgi:hypothetical protein